MRSTGIAAFIWYSTAVVLLSTAVLLLLYWYCTGFYWYSTAVVLVLFWSGTGQRLDSDWSEANYRSPGMLCYQLLYGLLLEAG